MAVKWRHDFTLEVVVLFFLLSAHLMASATVILVGDNVTMSFEDIEASFAPTVKSGKYGTLYAADPADGCSNIIGNGGASNTSPSFLLIKRGGCSFEEKVRAAQKAGYRASIVYDNYDGTLITMAGSSAGINIPAVFISKRSGEILKQYAGLPKYKVLIVPSFENSAWSIMAIAFISLLAMSAVLATCFFVRRHRIRRIRPNTNRVQEFQRMSNRSVKAMPSLLFTTVHEDNCTSRACAICLEDYTIGEKLRILPCRHKFHAFCVDSWLTKWRTFCPVCKRDARTRAADPPASESTPLLLSNPPSLSSSSVLSSFRSPAASPSLHVPPLSSCSPAASPSLHIPTLPSHSPAIPLGLSIPRPPYVPHSHSSRQLSPYIRVNRSSADLRNSYMASPHSSGYPSISPLNSTIMPFVPGSSMTPSSLVSSSGFQNLLLLRNDSAASLTPYASAHSLPDR